VLAVALVYANGLTGPFLPDDERAISTNPQIRQLSLAALDPPIETPVAGRPLVNLSFALNYAAGGLDVKGYHAANIALHALAALVLYGLVWRTLARSDGGSGLAAAAQPIAMATALVWAVHPLNTEAVTYLTQRSELLMGLSLLVTMYCALRAADSRHHVRWTVAAVAACLAGTVSKESMVVAPVLVVLFDRVFLYGSVREALTRRRALYLGLAANWLVLGWLMVSAPRSTVGGDAAAAWTYLLNQAVLVARYLRLAVWPVGLVSDYGTPRALSLGEVWMPGAVVVALVLLTLVALWRRPRLGFLGAWVFITLAPTSSVVPIVSEVGAERRMYLPLAALAVLAAVAVFRLLVRQSRPAGGGARMMPLPWVAAVAIVCAALSAGTMLRNQEYRSRMTLFQANVNRWPSGRARFSLADELIKADDHNAAVAQLQAAATADYPPAYYGLAAEMLGAGRVDDAAMYAREFIRLMPASPVVPTAHELIGQALLMQGKLPEAATEFTQLIDMRPNDPRPRLALGDVLLRQRKVDEAIIRYGEALDRRPGDPEILQKAGLALAAAQRLPEAASAFDRALSGRPDDIGLLNLLGRALAAQGLYAEAVGPFRRIVELAPSDSQAAENLKAMERFAAAQPPKPAPAK
jgi:tetratricopeptide (TPR) repeat protein